jgi:hypothetical protein
MPVFTALMTATFGADNPFNLPVRNDQECEGDNVRVLPDWVVESLERDSQFRRIVR